MIDIKVPKEINSYKEKIYFGLNLRQLICVVIALAINIPVYWFGRQYLGDDITSWIVILSSLPLMSIGFIHYNGMAFEKLIVVIIKDNYIKNNKRKYKSKNLYRLLNEYVKKEK